MWYQSIAVKSGVRIKLGQRIRKVCLYPNMIRIQEVTWIIEADLDSNCMPSMEIRQNPSKVTHFPSYGRHPLIQTNKQTSDVCPRMHSHHSETCAIAFTSANLWSWTMMQFVQQINAWSDAFWARWKYVVDFLSINQICP